MGILNFDYLQEPISSIAIPTNLFPMQRNTSLAFYKLLILRMVHLSRNCTPKLTRVGQSVYITWLKNKVKCIQHGALIYVDH